MITDHSDSGHVADPREALRRHRAQQLPKKLTNRQIVRKHRGVIVEMATHDRAGAVEIFAAMRRIGEPVTEPGFIKALHQELGGLRAIRRGQPRIGVPAPASLSVTATSEVAVVDYDEAFLPQRKETGTWL